MCLPPSPPPNLARQQPEEVRICRGWSGLVGISTRTFEVTVPGRGDSDRSHVQQSGAVCLEQGDHVEPAWSERERSQLCPKKLQAGLCIPVGIQLEMAEVGPTSGPTRRLSHLGTSTASFL